MHDIVVRNGLIYDGSGSPPSRGDVAIDSGRITAVGVVEKSGREEINAGGNAITPGFVDVHTHYDGQVLWNDRLVPSSEHGVTTVIMGNCAVGLAPCKPSERELLVKVMAGVEDIPEAVMTEGLNWEWETFPDYLDVLEKRHCDIDFAAQLPHGCVRVYVMGKRGADREIANIDDLARMTAVVEEAMAAGAIGISSSHSLAHRALDGSLAPAETAEETELLALARGLRKSKAGVIEFISDLAGLPHGDTSGFDVMRRMAETAGKPLSFTLVQLDTYPEGYRRLLDLVERANADGVEIRGQVAPRAVGLSFGFDLSFNPFSFRKSYMEVEHLPLAERVEALRDPARRARILAETAEHGNGHVLWLINQVANMYVLGEGFDYEPSPSNSLGSVAAAKGISPWALAYDLLVQEDGRTMLYLPVTNYHAGNLDTTLEMMRHPHTIVALGDGGAHYGMICDAAYPSFMLSHWARDRQGARMAVEEIVKALTWDAATAVGLVDRGLLRPGLIADLNIIDLQRVNLKRPEVRYDLPTGARRIAQTADGYLATIKSGVVTYRGGEHTGALPGRLVRGTGNDAVNTTRLS